MERETGRQTYRDRARLRDLGRNKRGRGKAGKIVKQGMRKNGEEQNETELERETENQTDSRQGQNQTDTERGRNHKPTRNRPVSETEQ